MRIGIPAEIFPRERRVAAIPETVERYIHLGFEVAVESDAGRLAGFFDDAYREAGAHIVAEPARLWEQSDLVLKVRPPGFHSVLGMQETELMHPGQHLLSFIYPATSTELMEQLAARGVTALALDTLPRISRAQKMDALSAMANVAGYRAVIEAAHRYGRFFGGQITAAGRIDPARVLIIGAGVAGLSAIGAAGSLGARVRAFDTRPEVREQVESLGARFLELEFDEDGTGAGGYAKVMSEEFLRAEMDLFARQAMEVDIIITTALIPGRPAPKLITTGMVESMRGGSVIVDLAAEQGGNCALTRPGEIVIEHGVHIVGLTNLPSRMPCQASTLFATNLYNIVEDLCPNKDGTLDLNMEDEIARGLTVVREGEITWASVLPREVSAAPPPQNVEEKPVVEPRVIPPKRRALWSLIGLAAAGLAVLGVGAVAPPDFLSHFTVFVLACLVGWQVIWNVTPALHTPLMSVTNAISGIIVLAALLQISHSSELVTLLAFIAVLVSSINIAGGFLVTQRMLRMFRK